MFLKIIFLFLGGSIRVGIAYRIPTTTIETLCVNRGTRSSTRITEKNIFHAIVIRCRQIILKEDVRLLEVCPERFHRS